jgi:dynein heavy chain
LDQIQVIERWSKHPEFLPYVQALEEWDEYWIKEHPMNNIFMHEISFELDSAFNKLANF